MCKVYLWLVVSNDPGENRILHQVIVCPPSDRIQMHQVLKVTYLPLLKDRQEKKQQLRNKSIQNKVDYINAIYSTLLAAPSTLAMDVFPKQSVSTNNFVTCITCHLTRAVFSTTGVFLKHNKRKYFELATEADHWAVPINTKFSCLLCCLATTV